MPRIADEWKRVFGQLPTEADIHEMYEEFEEILFSILPSYATPIDEVKEVIALRERGIKNRFNNGLYERNDGNCSKGSSVTRI